MRPTSSSFIARCLCLSLLPAAAFLPMFSRAQSGQGQASNVTVEYAQVLRVEPVYQTLRAYAVEEKCDPPVDAGQRGRNCAPVRVGREYRRAVAYDVEYIHRGVKYRSRLPIDPGKRLRVRITVTPDIPPGERR